MAGQDTFCGGKSGKSPSVWLPLVVVLLALGTSGISFAQTKPERQSKAAKPTQSAATSSTNASSHSAEGENDSGKP